jgi:histidyl-tRNA synthetase
MKIPAVKGTRDFYPPQMAVRNFIIEGWKAASLRNGFEEYDGPIFEYLKMFQVKSGDEIVEQLFNLTDRGGRDLAIRPEITPTLARMVNQQINSLPRPIKWFSVPRLCRAERPQKGRLREFFQWNIDIIGVDDVRADAEVIFTSIDYLRSAGLTDKDIKAKISSRKLLAAFLKNIGIDQSELESVYPVLDKKPKLPPEAFDEMLEKQVPDKAMAQKIKDFMDIEEVTDVNKILGSDRGLDVENAIHEQIVLFGYLGLMGIGDFCVFDPSIVRGLAYYTGVVFEVHDIVGELRALCGGGRYDNLLKDFGGPAVSATGMGMGDCVLEILLQQKGLIKPESTRNIDYYIICADDKYKDKAIELAAKIRTNSKVAEFSYKSGKIGKLMKTVSDSGAANCIILGQELEDGKLAVKDMNNGEQKLVGWEEFVNEL